MNFFVKIYENNYNRNNEQEKKSQRMNCKWTNKKRPNRQIMRNQFCENGAIYITKYLAFKKTKSRLSGKIGLYEMPEYLSLQIDSKFDLFLIEQILKKKGNLYEKN